MTLALTSYPTINPPWDNLTDDEQNHQDAIDDINDELKSLEWDISEDMETHKYADIIERAIGLFMWADKHELAAPLVWHVVVATRQYLEPRCKMPVCIDYESTLEMLSAAAQAEAEGR